MIDNIIVKYYGGSHAYGTNITSSDVDIRGVFCSEKKNILTPFFPIREVVNTNAEDEKYYELRHYMKLCLGCNPNMLEALWVDESDILLKMPEYDIMRDRRDAFLSSKIAFTTSGYAFSQLKRIKGHNKWINNPQPEEPPRQCDYIGLIYNFTEDKLLKFDITEYNTDHRLYHLGSNIYGIYEELGSSLYDRYGDLNTASHVNEKKQSFKFIVKFNKDIYNDNCDKHKNYWNWVNSRNSVRHNLEREYGYDTKHAMHLVRLLRMGLEALQYGVVNIKRPDAAELLEIRSGSMTYDELIKYATHMDLEMKKWYTKTDLRKYPDINLASDTIIEIQEVLWNAKK